MLNYEVFGEIQFETMWQKKDSYVLYGKEFEIILFIQGDENEIPTSIQKEAYIEFNNKKMLLLSEIEEKNLIIIILYAKNIGICMEKKQICMHQ